ncbi:MAG: hypothetical protein A2234_07235 [Elusimicrobia bacterium RIFOXYA2_FULL_58_8]|nr:MAG: hypothetical protein A2234_07235 [Elusimicrobia bacterium RIFOXYA2_FULL_58_8]OGS12658.1 MAG: hypothetical protein A2285_07685 [Elusimicrobia bacterium RIFOXYA12_FULL_57_11]
MAASFFLQLAAAAGQVLEMPSETIVPEPEIIAPVPHNAQGPQGGDDFEVFRLRAAVGPELSAAALLRLLGELPGTAQREFRDRHCGKIVEMLTALDKSVAAGLIAGAEYDRLADQLESFNIPVILRYSPAPGGVRKGVGNTDPVVSLVKTRATMNAGDVEKSEKAIVAVIDSFPENPSVRAAAAAYYAEIQNFAMAEKTATDAIALDSESPDAYRTRALARASLKDRKGAIEDIKKAVAIDPQDESARVLAVFLESRKPVHTLKTVSSLQAMRRSLGLPDDTQDAVKGSVAAAGQEPDALAAALPSPDSRSKIYLKTALSKNRLGDYESAVSYASLAIEKDPDNLDAYLERANSYNLLGRYDDAVRDTSFVIEKDPRSMQALNMRAWALNRNGRALDAETDASRAIGINPNFADAWFNRALSYEKLGDYRRMLEDFRQAAALSGAYSGRYQDAVAQYGPRVPGFVPGGGAKAYLGEEVSVPAGSGRSPLQRFMLMLVFTLTGGGLVAMGLVHIVTEKKEKNVAAARATHPDVLSPSVFYEGVATGKYRIEKKVGEGGMGQVYQAVDQSLGRKVAIKKMNEEIKVNDREKQRFLDEARTVALLHHPNVVEIYTIFEEEGDVYLVFEYVEGRPLDKIIDAEARVHFPRARVILDAAAKALAYAHSKGVVHRDLKLSNIMLSDEDEVKVMDFGLARRAKESKAMFSSKEVVGSPAYMAPEQEMGTSSVESDIYSLGVCFYEIITGVLPFQGPDFHRQKTQRAYQAPSASVPGLPAGVDVLLAKCLAPEPENRFRSVEEFRSALNAIV